MILRYITVIWFICSALACGKPDKVINPGEVGFAKTGEQIRKARLAQHISLETLAKAVDMKIATLSLIEDGMADPTPEKMVEIQRYLNVEIVLDGRLEK